MRNLQICFWACAAGVCWAYFLYPLLLLIGTRLRPRPRAAAPFTGSISIVIAAYNEERRIAARRDEMLSLIDAAGLAGELILISDGSTDNTAAAARYGADPRVRVIEHAHNLGKADCVSRACATATGDVLVFADTRQTWASGALVRLLENFADPRVGGVSGDLHLESAPGVAAGVGLYWRYEKAVRKLESCVHSMVGATGAICAVRRPLFRPIPPRTILDDVYWPLQVAMQGYRVIHDERARAFDRLPERSRDEFRRKVRTLSGNFQLVARLPAAVLPWRNPIWLHVLSHKLLRLAVPWMLIGTFLTSAILGGALYRTMLAGHVLAAILALAGMHPTLASKIRAASVATSFFMLNAAAWTAFWVWILGRSDSSWRKVVYTSPAASPASASAAAPAAVASGN